MGKKKRLPRRLPRAYKSSFPDLNDYVITSDETATYNCVGFAAGDVKRWWEPLSVPQPGYYWPPGAMGGDGNEDIGALKRCLAELGYYECTNGDLETGFTKVALYAIDVDDYKHVAIQEANGEWSSKLGDGFDIRHKTPHCVSGPKYGTVMGYMRRETVG